MPFSIKVENAALGLYIKAREMTAKVLTVVAGFAISEIVNNIPPSPPKGKMKFVSERQRRFVMAMISKGLITVPYKRDGRSPGSERLTKSMVVMKETVDSVSVVSTASYAQYVIGTEQAEIHKGRWVTGLQAGEKLLTDGTIDRIVSDAIADTFGA